MATDFRNILPLFEAFDEELNSVKGLSFEYAGGGAVLGGLLGGGTGAVIGGLLGTFVGYTEERDRINKVNKQLLDAIYNLENSRDAIFVYTQFLDKETPTMDMNFEAYILPYFLSEDFPIYTQRINVVFDHITELYQAFFSTRKAEKIMDFLDNWREKYNEMSLEEFIDYAYKETYLDYDIVWTDAYDYFFNMVAEALKDNNKSALLYDRFMNIMMYVASYVPVDSLKWKEGAKFPFAQMQKRLISTPQINIQLCGEAYKIYLGNNRRMNEIKQLVEKKAIEINQLEKDVQRSKKRQPFAVILTILFTSFPLFLLIIKEHNGFLTEVFFFFLAIFLPCSVGWFSAKSIEDIQDMLSSKKMELKNLNDELENIQASNLFSGYSLKNWGYGQLKRKIVYQFVPFIEYHDDDDDDDDDD